MKKKFLTLFVLGFALVFSSISTSCSKDDDDDNTKKENTNGKDSIPSNTTLDSAKIVESRVLGNSLIQDLENLAAVEKTNSKAGADLIEQIETDIRKYQALGNKEYQDIVKRSIKTVTGINDDTIEKILNNKGDISEVTSIISSLSDAEMNSLLKNATSYTNAYNDSKELIQGYLVITDENASYEKKMRELDSIEYVIKNKYQTSNDEIYKQTFVSASAVNTGMGEAFIENIFNADSPKATLIAMLGIKDPNENPAEKDTTSNGTSIKEQAKEDAAQSVALLEEMKGMTMKDLANDPSTIAKVKQLGLKYQKSSEEYKQAYIEEAKAEGYTEEEIVKILDASQRAETGDIAALMDIARILDIKFF